MCTDNLITQETLNQNINQENLILPIPFFNVELFSHLHFQVKLLETEWLLYGDTNIGFLMSIITPSCFIP